MIHSLTVIYDPRCGLCTQIKDWLGRQPAYVALRLLAAGSAEVQERFPMIPPGELAVISDSGEMWRGDNAWIICLWALCEYRQWAARLASPNCGRWRVRRSQRFRNIGPRSRGFWD